LASEARGGEGVQEQQQPGGGACTQPATQGPIHPVREAFPADGGALDHGGHFMGHRRT